VARKTIVVSDLTGRTIDEKETATVTISYSDARKGQIVLDVHASEVEDLAAKGTKQTARIKGGKQTNFKVITPPTNLVKVA
jgi:hypothetical protein